MTTQTSVGLEVEQQRQKAIAELVSENGKDWMADYKPGTFGCHELLDRTMQAAGMVEASILDHPACVQNAEWYALAEQAVATLNLLYQRVGGAHLSVGDQG